MKYVHTVVQLSPPSFSRTFSSSQTDPQSSLNTHSQCSVPSASVTLMTSVALMTSVMLMISVLLSASAKLRPPGRSWSGIRPCLSFCLLRSFLMWPYNCICSWWVHSSKQVAWDLWDYEEEKKKAENIFITCIDWKYRQEFVRIKGGNSCRIIKH